jgi:predicted Zn-dependent peptidase
VAADYQKTILPNGIRLVSERIPHVRSVAVGVWVDTGSRYEPAPKSGVSHFIEHLVFKGTETRTAEEVARAVDSVGGQMDAFTTKEHTCLTSTCRWPPSCSPTSCCARCSPPTTSTASGPSSSRNSGWSRTRRTT